MVEETVGSDQDPGFTAGQGDGGKKMRMMERAGVVRTSKSDARGGRKRSQAAQRAEQEARGADDICRNEVAAGDGMRRVG